MVEISQEELDRLKAKAEEKSQKPLSFKVSQKGALSVYGLGRFPVTLYIGQWERLRDEGWEELWTFAADHAGELSRK